MGYVFNVFSKRPTNALELLNVFLLRGNHGRVSATLVTVFRAVPTGI